MKVLIVVTHLLGTGHLSRALVIARAFRAAGHQVTLASGGMPAAHLDTGGIDFVQLPPVRSDGTNFTTLLDETGAPASKILMANRKANLLHILNDARPDAVITELFPFGRRILTDEFRTLLEAARSLKPRPVLCASVRDILAPPSKPAKADAARDLIASFYDGVLVHSDPSVVALDASWPVTPELARALHYTGFVAPAPAGPHPERRGAGQILVTSGGGSVGAGLFANALGAAALTPDWRWHLLIGGDAADGRIAALQGKATENVTVAPATSDFRQMLYHATASVSLCGYNTALDILQAGTPAVFVPFDEGGEVEQSIRAASLARLSGVTVVKSDDLSPSALQKSVLDSLAAPRRAPMTRNQDGARRTVEIVSELLARQSS